MADPDRPSGLVDPAATIALAHEASLAEPPLTSSEETARLTGLLLRIGEGDSRAFEAFYDATIPVALAFARRLVMESDVDDVLSDAYFDVWQQAARHEALSGAPLAWLMQLVRRHGLAHLQRAAERESLAELPPPVHELVLEEPCPQDALSRFQSGQQLQAALAALSAHERWVMALSYYRELSHSQISRHTGLPLGTVKSLILRAQGKLRSALLR
jgi:RNA polymerase sigma-70 factor (ECF subfamily)